MDQLQLIGHRPGRGEGSVDHPYGFNKPYPWLLADSGAMDILGNPNGELFLAQAVWHTGKPVRIAVQPVNHPGVKPAKAVWRGTNGEFATRTGMPTIKCLLMKVAGRKYDRMASRRDQKYYFIFVHEDGAALERISEIFGQNHLEASVDGVFRLDDVNEALKKVASGGSKGKTILKIPE